MCYRHELSLELFWTIAGFFVGNFKHVSCAPCSFTSWVNVKGKHTKTTTLWTVQEPGWLTRSIIWSWIVSEQNSCGWLKYNLIPLGLVSVAASCVAFNPFDFICSSKHEWRLEMPELGTSHNVFLLKQQDGFCRHVSWFIVQVFFWHEQELKHP